MSKKALQNSARHANRLFRPTLLAETLKRGKENPRSFVATGEKEDCFWWYKILRCVK